MENIIERLFVAIEPDLQRLLREQVERASTIGCESPIEVLFLAAAALQVRLWAADDGFVICNQSQETNKENLGKVLVMPQFVWGSYRIDFAVSDPDLPAKYIFVECDGHDFHERTKEQAERDRSKDRAVQAAGIPILRFTGREIYRDAGACVEQVWSTINKLARTEKPSG